MPSSGELIGRILAALAVGLVLVLLWLMPGVLFPHPGTNDALELAYLGPLLYLITLGASLLSLVGVAVRGWKSEALLGLGVFLFGIAAGFVLAIVTFGNFSDDRFAPLFLTPLLAVPVVVVLVVAGLVMRSGQRENRLLGAVRGAVVAGVVIVWVLARGATDWLQAPYGFDIYCLITVGAAVVLFLGADARKQTNSAQQ